MITTVLSFIILFHRGGMWLGDPSKVIHPIGCTARTQTLNPSPAPIRLHHGLLPPGQSAPKMGTFVTVHIGYIFLLPSVSDAAKDDALMPVCMDMTPQPWSLPDHAQNPCLHAVANKLAPRPLWLKFWGQCRQVGKIRKGSTSYSNSEERSAASHLNLSRSIIVNKEVLVLSGKSGYNIHTCVYMSVYCFTNTGTHFTRGENNLHTYTEWTDYYNL